MSNAQNPPIPTKPIAYLTDGMLRVVLNDPTAKPLIENPTEENIKTASYDVCLGERFLKYKWWPLIKDMRVDQTKYTRPLQVRGRDQITRLTNNRGLGNSLARFWFFIRNGGWFGVDDEGLFFLMRPLGFVCGVIVEKINLPANIGAILDGKSSTGRRAICVHITAGFADPGYSGRMTTEMVNFLWTWSKIRPGDRIGQLRFFYYAENCQNLYGSMGQNNHYQGAKTVEAGAKLSG